MTVKRMPSSARKLKAAEGTANSPEFQLLPENRGMSLPSARCSVSLSGNLITIRMALTLRAALDEGETSLACLRAKRTLIT